MSDLDTNYFLCECDNDHGNCKHRIPYDEAGEDYLEFCFMRDNWLISKDCPSAEIYRAKYPVLAEGEHYIIVSMSENKEALNG